MYPTYSRTTTSTQGGQLDDLYGGHGGPHVTQHQYTTGTQNAYGQTNVQAQGQHSAGQQGMQAQTNVQAQGQHAYAGQQGMPSVNPHYGGAHPQGGPSYGGQWAGPLGYAGPQGQSSIAQQAGVPVSFDKLPYAFEFELDNIPHVVTQENKRKRGEAAAPGNTSVKISLAAFQSVMMMPLEQASRLLKVSSVDKFIELAYERGIYEWVGEDTQSERITYPSDELNKRIMVKVTGYNTENLISQIKAIQLPGKSPFSKLKSRVEEVFNIAKDVHHYEFQFGESWVELTNAEEWDWCLKAWNNGSNFAVDIRIFPKRV